MRHLDADAWTRFFLRYPGINGQYEIVVRFSAGSENFGENFVHIGLTEKPGVQSIDLQEYTTRFVAPQISPVLPDWINFSRPSYEITTQFGTKQVVPYDSRSLYYLSHDQKLVSLRIGSEAILPRSGNCYEFYLNSSIFLQCLSSSSGRLNLGRIEVVTGKYGTFRLFRKKPDGSFEGFLGQEIPGNYGLPLAPGSYLIRIYEKSGDYRVEELTQEFNIDAGNTARITSPMIPTSTLETPFIETPWNPLFRLLPSNPAHFVGGPRGRMPYSPGTATVFRESFIQVATLYSGNPFTQLKPGNYTLWASGSRIQFEVDGTKNLKISLGRIGIAKNQDSTANSVFYVSQILNSGESVPLFDPTLAIPFGYYIDALPGDYEVTVCPFGIEQACQKIPHSITNTDSF